MVNMPEVSSDCLLPSMQSGTLRKINSVVIPIVYSEKFYKDVLDPSLDDINKLGQSSHTLFKM